MRLSPEYDSASGSGHQCGHQFTALKQVSLGARSLSCCALHELNARVQITPALPVHRIRRSGILSSRAECRMSYQVQEKAASLENYVPSGWGRFGFWACIVIAVAVVIGRL